MCGIFGYIGNRNDAGKLVIEGLKHLEYRGYDSWGIAIKEEGNSILLEKDIGKISEVDSNNFTMQSNLAIAHTRWATHGGVTKENAHPHICEDCSIAVVHNGIIENYEELREELKQKGYDFKSQTDSEVIPHLIQEELKNTNDFAQAVRSACKRFKGRYGLLAMDLNSKTLVAARTGSPLIIGVKKDTGYFIASDIPAFMEHTKVVQYLDDGEMVVTNGESILFTDIETGEEHPKREIEITWSIEKAQKGEFDHFMLKEIMEQKDSIARAVNQNEQQIKKLGEAIRNSKGTFLVGCGTAHKACMVAEYFFSVVAQEHVNVTSAGEFKLYNHFLTSESLLIVVSQSGETADVLEAMKIAKSKGAKVLAIINSEGSTIAREADDTLLINAGPERAVASTKALTGQMAVLMLIAYSMKNKLKEGKMLLLETTSLINDMLNPRYIKFIEEVAENMKDESDLYIIGKSWNFPMALESAIKIQEVSYVHAEGFAGSELKHGPIALVEKGTPCITLAGDDEIFPDIISNTIELKARGANTIGVSPIQSDAFDTWIKVPNAGVAQAIVNIIPIQVLAYYLAVKRGMNPDMPRNLAKSVTVK
ncbi:MAG: glutamine--fructose-6-phosphate transaminase (isomerizing) [Candidatus Peribacteraceae bacterium]|nr:glutamine--fructose-6-phosphate transaminase (isomerizing) [Candidatus Peribacteraceae bacterium]